MRTFDIERTTVVVAGHNICLNDITAREEAFRRLSGRLVFGKNYVKLNKQALFFIS